MALLGKGDTPCSSKTWGMVEFPPEKFKETCNRKRDSQCRDQPALGHAEGDLALECHKDAPGGAVPHRAGARCLPLALVARGAAVPTLASAGTPLAAAATTQDRHQTTHNATPTSGTFGPQNCSE